MGIPADLTSFRFRKGIRANISGYITAMVTDPFQIADEVEEDRTIIPVAYPFIKPADMGLAVLFLHFVQLSFISHNFLG